MHKNATVARLSLFAMLFALLVIAMGATTRLKNAGLGCPDWPGCYGHWVVPSASQVLSGVYLYGLNTSKAWAEMIHRYLAGTLGLLIVCIFILSAIQSKKNTDFACLMLPLLLLLLLIYQAVLGMWTVTLKLLPLVVSQHLLGGMMIVCLLWLMFLSRSDRELLSPAPALHAFRPWVLLGLILVVCQVALGAWTSTNYAAISCSSFPFCQAQHWFPHWDFVHAYRLLSPIGPDYQGGVLNQNARQTIQMVHRIGAMVVSLYLFALVLALSLSRAVSPRLIGYGFLVLMLLCMQFALGILNVVLQRPLLVAVAHNMGAALLLMAMVLLSTAVFQSSARRHQGGSASV